MVGRAHGVSELSPMDVSSTSEDYVALESLHDGDESLSVVGVPKLLIVEVGVIVVQAWKYMHRQNEFSWGC